MVRHCMILALVISPLALLGCGEEEAPEPQPIPAAAEQPTAAGVDGVAVDEATRVRFQTLIDIATLHIRNREFEAADTVLRELEKMTGTLPPAMRQQIETTRAALVAARGARIQPPAAPIPPPQP